MKKRKQTPDTYKRAMSRMMSHLLLSFLRKKREYNKPESECWETSLGNDVIPIGALIVPFAISDAKEWWIGWYRGKDDKGYDLIESVETHNIMRFYNCGYLFLEDLEFSTDPRYRYSDRQYEIIDRIKKRVARHNYWFVVGNPEFHEDGSIEVPIRQKFHDEFYKNTYKNLRELTIAALDKQCEECEKMGKESKGGNQ